MNNLDLLIYDIDFRGKSLIDIIQKQGPIAKNKIIDITKMKLSTLNRIMDSLINEEIIVEVAMGESTGGRKPILFDVNENKFFIIGVDISRTYIQIVITNLKMKVLSEKLILDDCNIYELETLIINSIKDLIIESNVDENEIIAIGFGVVESINRKSELGSIFYKYTSEENSKKFCSNIFKNENKVPIFVDNGANAAVIGEYYFGSGIGKHNVSYFNCGVGIRTGSISYGKLIRTINNTEDSFGHMIIDMDGELCNCGNYGCVESYCSIVQIKDKFIKEIKKGKKANLSKDLKHVTYDDVCNLAEENDETAREIIVGAAAAFGNGLANYINLLNPQLVILSGPLIKHSKLFYEVSKEVALKKCHLNDINNITFVIGGHFEGKSMAVGAAAMAFERILNNNEVGNLL